MVVTNLNVEPGGYGTRSTLSMNGLRGSSFRNLASAVVRWPVMMLGSNAGLDTWASTRPVSSSTTTTAAAGNGATARSAMRCRSASSVSTTL